MSVNYNPATPSDGLILCLDSRNPRSYPGSGTTWFDISGNNNHGTLTSGPVFTNNGFSFDGVDDYVSVSTLPSLTSQYTLAAWVRLSSIRNYHTLFYRGNSTSGDIEFYSAGALQSITLAHNRNNGGSIFYAANNGSTSGSPNIGNWGAFPTNTFTHYVLTYGSNSWRLYKDGFQIGKTIHSVSNPSSTSSTWRIGGTPNTATFTTTNEWEGLIDNVRMYNRPISTTEVQQLFQAQRARYGV